MIDDIDAIGQLLQRPLGWLQAAQLAQVVSVDDPEGMNRVQLRLIGCDASDQQDAPLWARVVCPFAGKDRGAFLIPDVDDEVLVMFVNGDAALPLVIGGLWNGAASAPADIGADGNRYKRIRSRNGVTVTLDDQSGQEAFVVETPGGQRLRLQDGPAEVQVEDASGNRATFQASGISLVAATKLSIDAPQIQITAGSVNVDTAYAKFSGVVDCQTLVSTSVVSTSYTPGAGNVW